MPMLSELSLSSNKFIKPANLAGFFVGVCMAGFELDIQSNIKQLTKELNNLQRKIIPRVVNRSLNKVGSTVNTQAVKRIGKETKLPAKFIKAKIKIVKSRNGQLVWTLKALRGGTTNIIEWVSAAQQKPKNRQKLRNKQAGVVSKAWGKSKTYPGTFIGRAKNSGKLMVFVRDPSKSSGVKSVQGPNVRSAFGRALVGLQSVANRRFIQVFEHELAFELSKLK